MSKVVGIRFKEVGKIYYFDPLDVDFKKGDFAIVETVRGIECGEVAMENRMVEKESIVQPLKKVIRKSTRYFPILICGSTQIPLFSCILNKIANITFSIGVKDIFCAV
jgi:hypothetical protein